jgi:hypothetical protein
MSFPGTFAPGLFASAAPALTTLTQALSAVSTAPTITGPAGILAGDLLVLVDIAATAGIPTAVVPSGFNTIANTTDGIATRQILSYKVADGSEASASLTGMAVGSGTAKVLVVFRGNVPIATAVAQDAAGEVTTGNPSAQVANASSGVAPLVVVAGYGSSGTIDPRSFSPSKDGEVENQGGAIKAVLAWKVYNASPADVTIDMDDESGTSVGNGLQSCYLACS